MFRIETFIGRGQRWFPGDRRYPTRAIAEAEILAMVRADRFVNPEIRTLRRVVPV